MCSKQSKKNILENHKPREHSQKQNQLKSWVIQSCQCLHRWSLPAPSLLKLRSIHISIPSSDWTFFWTLPGWPGWIFYPFLNSGWLVWYQCGSGARINTRWHPAHPGPIQHTVLLLVLKVLSWWLAQGTISTLSGWPTPLVPIQPTAKQPS